MECPRCGSITGTDDRFCRQCGFPVRVRNRDGESTELTSFFLDVVGGVMLINEMQVSNVTEFLLQFNEGRYNLMLTCDKRLEATAPLGIGKESS